MTATIARRVAGTAVSFAALVFASSAFAASGIAPKPVFPNEAPALGPALSAFLTAPTQQLLTTKPDTAIAGSDFTVSGSGLPAGKPVTLTWSTANVDWLLDARPDSVDYLGRKATSYNVQLGTAQTDSSGAFSLTVKAPQDWGGLHDIYALVDGVAVAKGGFLIARHATISPKSGPIGTPITITYSGLGSKLYEGSAAMTYDNKFMGQATANWNRGVAVAHIRAAGPVGKHVIVVTDAVNFPYMNIPQSPNPWASGAKLYFKVTKDAGRPKLEIDWPAKVTPTMSSFTTVLPNTSGQAKGMLSVSSGQILTKVDLTATGLDANTPVSLQWASVVGNRVNCTGTCWATLNVPLGDGTAAADGTLSAKITVPDGLGGWHAVQLLQNGQVKAQVPFFVKRSFASAQPISDLTLRAGQHFTVHLKGLGWTQLDNTIAVDYDNAYIGYACGFNSQGDTMIEMTATGEPGTHLIDLYPLLYTQQPSYANTMYGMMPILSYRTDLPGLALGYQLPAMRLAITVVK
ncbi:MAG TPA: hypothetical protein VGQ38_14345 [Gaiellaceae bacterium]|jgi:hypothetical protein|nr:hypothetical protein [Gaiellaceae bacterium]